MLATKILVGLKSQNKTDQKPKTLFILLRGKRWCFHVNYRKIQRYLLFTGQLILMKAFQFSQIIFFFL